MVSLSADGIYVSAHNKNLRISKLRYTNYKVIGSAHNIKELNLKVLQGCSCFIFSRLFQTRYTNKRGFMGIIKFNLFKLSRKEKLSNLNKLSLVKSNSFALLSEIKKKPANIINRLF